MFLHMKRFAFAFCLLCIPPTLTGQTGPEVAPGLRVPGTSMPYALDSSEGKSALVPIHHSSVTVNNHPGANVAGAMAGSFFYKPKVTTELPGAAAAVTLRSRRPVLYFHLDGQDDPGADHNENLVGWAIVRAKPDKDRRIVGQIRITQLTGHGKHSDDIIDTKEDHLPNGWTTLTPIEDLANGQYVFTPIYKGNLFASSVYAFGIDPSARENELAIKPGATADPLVQ
jgi:hypothetical protein